LIIFGSEVTTILELIFVLLAAASSALAADFKLPEP